MKSWIAAGFACLTAVSAAGCTTDGLSGGIDPAASASLPGPTTPAPAALGAFLEGPIGGRLGDADRDAALKAQTEAVATGDRKTWRGSRGTYGYVVPAAASTSAEGECRSFTHTIYFAGRPQTGHGSGCRGADGEWRIAS